MVVLEVLEQRIRPQHFDDFYQLVKNNEFFSRFMFKRVNLIGVVVAVEKWLSSEYLHREHESRIRRDHEQANQA